MNATNIVELRRNDRFSPNDLFAVVGEEIVHVDNISVAGICINRPANDFIGRNVRFWVAPVSHGFLDETRAVEVDGHIVGRSEDRVRIVFSTVSYDLSNMIHRYKATQRA